MKQFRDRFVAHFYRCKARRGLNIEQSTSVAPLGRTVMELFLSWHSEKSDMLRQRTFSSPNSFPFSVFSAFKVPVSMLFSKVSTRNVATASKQWVCSSILLFLVYSAACME